MARVFWVECPACATEFHVHHGDLRHSGVELRCPTCGERFLDEEAQTLRE